MYVHPFLKRKFLRIHYIYIHVLSWIMAQINADGTVDIGQSASFLTSIHSTTLCIQRDVFESKPLFFKWLQHSNHYWSAK